MNDPNEPKLTSFSVSEFQRERDVISYCFGILEDLGGDGQPMFDSLSGVLYRIKMKVKSK